MSRPTVNTVGRTEFIADISLSSLDTTYNLPTQGGQIPNDRFLFGLLLQFEGRITNAASNNPTGQQADAPFSLIDTVQVQGFHRIRGQQETFINARGADLRELALIYTSRAPFNQNSLSNTANATNDIRFFIPVFFTPMGVSLAQQIDYLLDAPNYDALKLNIVYSDDQSIFTYGTRTAPAFTAFGGATGSPRLRVSGIFAQAGRSQFANFVPARVWRYFAEDTSSDVTSSTTGARMINIPRGYRMRSLLLKTGAKSTAVAAGMNAYNTLSNSILANLKVMRGLNKQIRYYADQFQAREDGAIGYSISPDTGFQLIDFAQHGSWHEALDLTGLAAGPSGDTDCYLQADTTGAANQGVLALWEELRGLPLS